MSVSGRESLERIYLLVEDKVGWLLQVWFNDRGPLSDKYLGTGKGQMIENVEWCKGMLSWLCMLNHLQSLGDLRGHIDRKIYGYMDK